MTSGNLYLVPMVIAEDTHDSVIPPQVKQVLPGLAHFLVEDVRTARRYLSSLKLFSSIESLHFEVLNKETPDEKVPELLRPLVQGQDVGVLSESGCPGVADPGSKAVLFAHQHSIRVIPLVGPSSLLLALMASGLNGQQFAFHGYLPIDATELAAKVKTLERESKSRNQTQLFIETPHRNNSLFEQFLKHLQPETLLSIALDLTGKNEKVVTRTIAQWRKGDHQWPKSPMVYLFLAK
jgi:16S rRNA (cytidine1402-2'-O)-methyltransferase